MSKNVVVHISTVHSWQDPRIFQKECKSLAKAGFEVHLITPDGVNLKREGVFVHKLNVSVRNKLSRYLFATKAIFKQARKLNPSIIHFHDPELIPQALRARNNGYKVIYDIHEDNLTAIQHREYLNPLLKQVAKKVLLYYESKAKNKLHTIIAEEYYSKRFPNSVEILNYPILNWQDQINNKPNTFEDKLIYSGNIRTERGAIIYADIINKLDSTELLCIGRCDESLAKQMKKIAGTKSKNLTVKGVGDYVPFSEILDAYASRGWLAGLAIFPDSDHFREKHLTKFFEYMAAGIPILYSDFPEWKRLLDPLKVGFSVDPNNLDQILSKIRLLKENPDLWGKFSNNGINASKNKFNWKKEESKLLHFYSSLKQKK